MTKSVLSLLSALAVAFTLTACKRNDHEHENGEQPGHEHSAAQYICPMKCEGGSSDKPGKCPTCGMALKAISDKGNGHAHTATGEATTKISVRTAAPLQVGEKAEVIVKLAKPDGSPMLLSDLKEAHTKKIHLLIIDRSLTDYHHEHPEPTATPGEYGFSFTPRKSGPYRVWADLVPVATDAQEYAIADIAAPAEGEPITDRTVRMETEVEGLRYQVVFNKAKIRAGEAVLGKLKITGPDGKLFTQLEPIMATYAHLVGFNEDYQDIVHIHPLGVEPTSNTDRGAGSLEFHLQAAKPGLMRLYAQVQIGGVSKFAPFTLNVEP